MCASAPRSSESASGPDCNRVVRRKTGDDFQQIVARKRHAARRRAKVIARDMDEYRTAGARNDRAIVESEDDNHIVEMVITPQRFGTGAIGKFDRSIVARIVRRIAPTIVRMDRLHRHSRMGSSDAIASVENSPDRKNTDWRDAIAF